MVRPLPKNALRMIADIRFAELGRTSIALRQRVGARSAGSHRGLPPSSRMACFGSHRAQEGRHELSTRPSSSFEGTGLECWGWREDRSRWAVSGAFVVFRRIADAALAQNWRRKVVHHDGALPHRRVDVGEHRNRRARHLQDGTHRSPRTHRNHSSGASLAPAGSWQLC